MAGDAIIVRPMRIDDLERVLALQARCYPPELHDSRAALESRLRHAPGLNFIAEKGGVLCAYIVAHPWRSLSPPPVDMVMTEPPEAEVCYVHDLSVSPDAGGGGLGRRLFDAMHAASLAAGLSRSELTAVRGAASYWARLGYAPVACDAVLAAKVAGYGDDAVYMARDL